MKLNFFQKVWAMYQTLGMRGKEFEYVATDATIWDSSRLLRIEKRLEYLEEQAMKSIKKKRK